jgi:CBS domain containing-hemolysin-like protein
VLELLAVAVFITLNGFFVAAEFALVKLRATHSNGKGKKEKKGSTSDLVADAVSKIDRYLSVTQLGITLASLGLGWLGEPAIAHQLEAIIARFVKGPLPHAAETAIVGVSFSLLTYAHVLFGELVPKLIAIQKSTAVARAAVWPLRITYYVFLPGLWVLETSSRAILSRFGINLGGGHAEGALSEDEILGILAAHVAQGKGGEAKEELIRRMMRFSGRVARQAMVPRVDVHYLPLSTPGPQALAFFRTHEYSRVPLSKGAEIDQVVGYLYWKDLVREPTASEQPTIEKLRREVLFVPESQTLVQVLRAMQQAHTPFAIVVDEYGGTSGILTMEDLLEEIVGEIRDESDDETLRIEPRGEGWEVDGAVLLDELESAGIRVGKHGDHDTLGAVLLSHLKRIPRMGDAVELGEVRVEVIALARRRVARARITRLAPKEEETDGEG